MTHIEIKKYFNQQREMSYETAQTVQLPPDVGDIAKTVFWEKNQYVIHNPKIEPSQIIAKTSTDPSSLLVLQRFALVPSRIE